MLTGNNSFSIIQNKTSYSRRSIKQLSLVAVGCIIAALFYRGPLLHELLFFTMISTIVLTQKFTYELIIDGNTNSLKIIYYTFLMRKSLHVQLSDAEFSLENYQPFKAAPYSLLKITSKGKIAYKIDSRDGIPLESVMDIVKEIKSHTVNE
jgi:hypothetical protein